MIFELIIDQKRVTRADRNDVGNVGILKSTVIPVNKTNLIVPYLPSFQGGNMPCRPSVILPMASNGRYIAFLAVLKRPGAV